MFWLRNKKKMNPVTHSYLEVCDSTVSSNLLQFVGKIDTLVQDSTLLHAANHRRHNFHLGTLGQMVKWAETKTSDQSSTCADPESFAQL